MHKGMYVSGFLDLKISRYQGFFRGFEVRLINFKWFIRFFLSSRRQSLYFEVRAFKVLIFKVFKIYQKPRFQGFQGFKVLRFPRIKVSGIQGVKVSGF
jgi:hypothetical protein